MEYAKGQHVRHPARPEWGAGEILDVTNEAKLKVYFQPGGFKTLAAVNAGLEIIHAEHAGGRLGIPLRLTVSADAARRLIAQIPHSNCTAAAPERWRVAPDGTVAEDSINWLFCWAKTGMGSENASEAARKVFDAILPVTFDQYKARVDHEYAPTPRY